MGFHTRYVLSTASCRDRGKRIVHIAHTHQMLCCQDISARICRDKLNHRRGSGGDKQHPLRDHHSAKTHYRWSISEARRPKINNIANKFDTNNGYDYLDNLLAKVF